MYHCALVHISKSSFTLMHVVTILRFAIEFILIINCTCYFNNLYGNQTVKLGKQTSYHDRVYIYLYSRCTNTQPFCDVVNFVRCLMSSFAYKTPSPPPPPRPKTPFTYVVYVYRGISLSEGHLGSRGGKHLKRTERHQFHLFNERRHNFSVVRTHAQQEY